MAAQKPSLQDGINRAGSPMQLLWSQNPPPWLPENIEPEPGAEVTVTRGEHPGAGTNPDADLGFPQIRATVQPTPFDQHARKAYRRHEL